MDKFEKLVKDIMQEAEADGEPVTRKEAEEMAQMEIKSTANRRYETTEKTKKRKPKQRKVDKEKKHLLGCVKTLLEGMGANILKVKTETEIHFLYGENDYTIKLTKHRLKK